MGEKVENWMTVDVVAVAPDTSLEEVDALLTERGIRRLAVIDDGTLLGVLSLGDVRTAKASAAADMSDFSQEPTAADLMTPDPITIPRSASLGLAAQTMLQLKVSGLPVIGDDGKVCGLLSESDLFRYIVATTV
ncbi:MAG: CBS domain-containing protein [Gammaproteobacteria bacterium]